MLLDKIASLIIPCYIANATPLITAKIIGKTHPLDARRYFIDGRRLLGDGKSIEGFVTGILAGTLAGMLWNKDLVFQAFILSLGSMTGDAVGSFIKRRIGLKRGDPAPLLDQLSFIVMALIFYTLSGGTLTFTEALIILLLTPPVHILTNYIAHRLGLKDKPW